MSKKTVFSRPTPNENVPRNAFDRSFRKNLNLSCGMLLPTFSKFVLGKSKCTINQSAFFRSSAVNTAAFVDFPMFTDYYFVPMRLLLTNWGAFRTMVDDSASSVMEPPRALPFVSPSLLQSSLTSMVGPTHGDSIGYDFVSGAIRLLDLLNYGVNVTDATVNTQRPSHLNAVTVTHYGNISPFFLAAYQKCYYDHYRNTAYENNDVSAFNLDRFIGSQGEGEQLSADVLKKLLTLRYVNYRKDLFNNIYPSLNFVQSNTSVTTSLPSNVLGLAFNPTVDSAGGGRVFPSTLTNAGDVYNLQQAMSTQNLRAAFALEKLLRASAFAPQYVKDQYAARFGYSPKYEGARQSVRIGSFNTNIHIGEVTSTADTGSDGMSLGAIGGKGIGASDFDKPISFTPDEDGIIIGLSYVLPRQMYDSHFIDPIHQKFNPEDWYQTEYLNLGLQPFLQKNLQYRDDPDGEPEINANVIIGLQPRDSELKLSVDVNHGVFNAERELEYFTVHGKSTLGQSSSNGVGYPYFKCDPADYNPIFMQAYNGTEYTDQFFGTIKCAFACIQNLPILGIPNI